MVLLVVTQFYMALHDFNYIVLSLGGSAPPRPHQVLGLLHLIASLVCPMALACGALQNAEKTGPWSSGARTSRILTIFTSFTLMCPMRLPAAIRQAQKKHAPGVLDHVPLAF